MSRIYSKFIHFNKIFVYRILSVIKPIDYKSQKLSLNCPPTQAPLKIFTYEIPSYYERNDNFDLDLVYQTFISIRYFFKNCVTTSDPSKADYFFLPLNLHKFQVQNKDPSSALKYCKYLGKNKNHLIIATGDFSQRDGNNHYGKAYKTPFPWLNNFKLLALESTKDLIGKQDIGIIPFNTLVDFPTFNQNIRQYLYSFIGETQHVYLPSDHIRHRLTELVEKPDVYIGKRLSNQLRAKLYAQFPAGNDYELLSRNSTFTLCPAGYGRWTYRFFQSITWGSIPVLISDSYVLPFSDRIPYSDFCLRIKESDFDQIDDIIRSISSDTIKKMQNNLKKAQHHFTKNAFFEHLSHALITHKS